MKPKTIIISVFLALAILTACHDETGHFREAETCLEQGCQHIADKQTEAAAQSLSLALLAIDRCDPTKPEVQRLKGLIEDNLASPTGNTSCSTKPCPSTPMLHNCFATWATTPC